MTRNFVHIHASGYHSADEEQFTEDLYSYFKDHKASIVTGTELEYQYKKEVVRSLPERAGIFAGSQTYSDDTYIVWDKTEWKEIYRETYQTTSIQWVNVSGKLRDPQYAKIVVLNHLSTGRNVLVSVLHAPSSVDAGNGLKNDGKRVAAWIDGTRNWKKRRNKISRKYKCTAMLIAADWNVDFKKAPLRAVVKAVQPKMRFTLDPTRIPDGGTHGNRLIDFSMIRGMIRVVHKPVILPKTIASDHRAYKETLRIM